MLLYLREIIQRPDVSALSLMWNEGSGPLVDGGVTLNASGLAAESPNGDRVDEAAMVTMSASALVRPAEASARTAADWTAAQRGIDGELALLYLLDTAAFRALVVKHQQYLGQLAQMAAATAAAATHGRGPGIVASQGGGRGVAGAGGSGGIGNGPSGTSSGSVGDSSIGGNSHGGRGGKAFASRRMKSVGALQGFGSFVSRKVTGGSRRFPGGGGGDGGDSDVSGEGRSGRKRGGNTGGFGELSAGKMAELRQQRERPMGGSGGSMRMGGGGGGGNGMMGSGFNSMAGSSPSTTNRSLSRQNSWSSATHRHDNVSFSLRAATTTFTRDISYFFGCCCSFSFSGSSRIVKNVVLERLYGACFT